MFTLMQVDIYNKDKSFNIIFNNNLNSSVLNIFFLRFLTVSIKIVCVKMGEPMALSLAVLVFWKSIAKNKLGSSNLYTYFMYIFNFICDNKIDNTA